MEITNAKMIVGTFDESYFIGEIVLQIPENDDEIMLSEKPETNRATFEVEELLEQGFKDGDVVVYGFADFDVCGIQFIMKKGSLLAEQQQELERLIDQDVDTIEEFLDENDILSCRY